MGDREVDEIIAKWRDSARAAGEPDAQDPEPGPAGRSIRGRWLLILAVFVVVAAGAVWLVPTGEPDSVDVAAEAVAPPPSDPPAPPPEATLTDDWYEVMADVDRARETAYRTADDSALSTVFAAGSLAHQHETALVADLNDRGLTAQGWQTEILAVSPVSSTLTDAQVRVIDSRAAYRLVGGDGAVTAVPAADPATWLVDFTKSEGGWRVTQVSPDLAAVTIPSGQP